MVLQQFNPWIQMTTRANVMVGPMREPGLSQAEVGDKADAHLARVGLPRRKDACPGFLSAGEQQRVVIARPLAREPGLMPLDRPTGAPDPEPVGGGSCSSGADRPRKAAR